MKQEEQLISRFGKDSGMKVPEGYFPELEQRIMQNLPPYKKATPKLDTSRWQRVKPYVYLAAMFCGIWLMMKVFHMATTPVSMGLDNPPQALVEMLDNGWDYDAQYYLPYSGEYDGDDEELILSYDNIEDFKKDFYSSL